MNAFETLKQTLFIDGKEVVDSLDEHIQPSFDIAKLYAHIELKLERERLMKALTKRAEKGVTWNQLADLHNKILLAHADIPRLQKLISVREKRVKDLTEKDGEEDNFKRAVELADKARNDLSEAIENRDLYRNLMQEAGVITNE